MSRRFFWAILTISLFLVACSTSANASPAQIIGTSEWHLTQLNGSTISSPVVTLQLTDTTIGGQGFCNSYHGPLHVTGNTIKLDSLASTRRMCVDEGVMQQEQAYFAALTATTQVKLNGNQLELLDANNTVVLVFAK
ncbi:MAG: META domain-containing protein [Chloroflexia bacterium]|nr:META domain-containing protein [Chloroflexia bacterium]